MVHSALEPYVRLARESPDPHPAALTALQRRDAYRARARAWWLDPEPLDSVVDVELELDDRRLAARLYTPFSDEQKALVIFFHGGSFVAGDLDSHDALCRRLAADTRMRYLAVDYRLAPEHPFPAAIDDARDAIRYVAAHLNEFVRPTAKLLVMGDSAGATIVAVAIALTRSEGLNVAAQILIYPTLGPEILTNSGHAYNSGYLLDVDHLRFDYGQYLGTFSDHADPRVSPLMFDDLKGSPPAIVMVAECDPLRDEAVAYAGLLENFGVPVELLEAKGMLHGFLRLGGLVPAALEIVDDLAQHMRRYVDGAPS